MKRGVFIKFSIENYRIFQEDEKGKLLAEITFPIEENHPDIVNVSHTFVDPSLRGQGIAGEMMKELISYLRNEHLKVIPTCSYAVDWFEKHPEDRDLLL